MNNCIIIIYLFCSNTEKEQLKQDADNNSNEMNERITELTTQNKGLLEYINIVLYFIVIFIIKINQ